MLDNEHLRSLSCVHKNIVDRLSCAALERIKTLLPASDAGASQQENAYAQVEAYLDSEPHAVTASASAECLVHHRRCPLSLSRDRQRQRRDTVRAALGGVSASSAAFGAEEPGPLSVNTGSNVCVSWSSVGKRAGTAHESELPFLVWRRERVAVASSGGTETSREDIAFQECTRLFPVEARWARPLEVTASSICTRSGEAPLSIVSSATAM